MERIIESEHKKFYAYVYVYVGAENGKPTKWITKTK